MVSCLNPPEPDRPASFVFLRILIDGRIKLFCNYSKRTTYSGGGPTIPDVSIPIPGSADIVFPGSSPAPYIKGYKIISKPIIQDSTGAFVKINELNFKRKMKSYADDCKELRYKINTEKYTFSDLYTVVKEYNECIR
jgi:hypothetical protein